MTIDNDVQQRGVGFVPLGPQRRYMGYTMARAQHKADPDHFIVEEKQPGYQCTVSTKSDFACQEELDACKGRFIAFTLVTLRMTTSAGMKAAARAFNVDPSLVTVAGNKDRTARTAQAAVVEIDDLDLVRRCSMPDEQVLREQGFFIKDVRRTNSRLGKGRLEGNRFSIRLLVPGMKKDELNDYLEPRLKHILSVHGNGHDQRPYIPNFFWRQRLGRRQNLLGVGVTLITEGMERGIERFMCEVVESNDHPLATKIRKELAALWMAAKARAKGGTISQQHYAFLDMLEVMQKPTYNKKPSYQPANMFIEHTLATEMAKHRSFGDMGKRNRSVRDDMSLWVGAYQSYWYNQVLGRVLDGDIPTSELEVGEKDGELLLPLYFPGDEKSVAFYERVCPEAIPHRIDNEVRRLFLTNPDNRRGPRRPAFITVNDLEYSVHDEYVDFKFLLRSGAYATNFLSLLFDLDSDVLGVV